MKQIILVFLAFGMLFANTPQQALDAYYNAFMLEDIDSFMDAVDTSNTTSEQVSNTRELTMLLWQQYDTDSYSISELECLEDGDDALCEYRLHAKISGAESLSYDLEYIALLHKVSGEWKVSFAMPLDEYLETREEQEKLAMVDAMLDDEHDLYFQAPQDGQKYATFNGEPLQDLTDELDEMFYSCFTDEYCQQNGYGNSCSNGECIDSIGDGWADVGWEDISVEPEQASCPLSFGLLLIPLMLVLKTRN